jgi:transcriptional regulator with XRE-family HTH domain
MTVREEVAKNLLFYRKKSGLTQKTLANELGVKHNSVSSWEKGINSIDVEILFKICEILNVSVNDMYGMYSNACAEEYDQAEKRIIESVRTLDESGQRKVIIYIDDLVSALKYREKASDEIQYVYKAAFSDDNREHGIVPMSKHKLEKMRKAPRVTSEDDL